MGLVERVLLTNIARLDSIGSFEREERIRLRIWLKGERVGLSFYEDLEQMDEQALRRAFRELAGEEAAQRRKRRSTAL